MKRLLSYRKLVFGLSLLISACSNQGTDVLPDDTANVEIKISMPMQEYPHSKAVTYKEDGTPYENTIFTDKTNMENISIFVFDADNGEFLDMVTDLTIQGKPDDVIRNVSGVLSTANFTPATKNLKLVFMANYFSRGYRIPSPSDYMDKPKYKDWREELIYDYSDEQSGNKPKPWTPENGNEDNRYIPMSGDAVVPVITSGSVKNYYAKIDLTRAVAKVRVEVVKECPYELFSLRVNNIPVKGYCLPSDKFHIPSNTDGASEILTLFANTDHPNYIEFYIPEQIRNIATIDLYLQKKGGASGEPTTSDKIYFMNYTTLEKFNIERNHYYIFYVNKKANDHVDVDVSVMDWVEHDIDVNYE